MMNVLLLPNQKSVEGDRQEMVSLRVDQNSKDLPSNFGNHPAMLVIDKSSLKVE